MRLRQWLIYWVTAALLCNAWLSLSRAAEILGDSPKVVAKAFGELPANASIAVRPDKKTELNTWVRAAMISYLKARGFVVDDDGRFVLMFRTELHTNSYDGSRFSLEVNRGRSREDTLFLDYNVPLGERPGPGASSYLAISATLSQLGEQPIWHGTASARSRHRHSVELQPVVVAALINALGKTVGQEAFY